ncbi:15041_t:CDS:2 [Dentiscutata erythropus]|uniref:15041_t:CDS:1 n=1 Tax=Dentiscutata erythropus TaxID=1348616 RepID=A0A9N9DX04_9GLOM|nr:15041_t:CDS:2 [Dentiscutata erythropus]
MLLRNGKGNGCRQRKPENLNFIIQLIDLATYYKLYDVEEFNNIRIGINMEHI